MIDAEDIPRNFQDEEKDAWCAALNILHFLRSKDGCSWDQQQTMESILDGLIEEVSELIDSIHRYSQDSTKQHASELIEEFGDVNCILLMLMLIFEEKNRNSITQIYDLLRKKLVRRHPHVFAPQESKKYSSLHEQWHSIKYHVEGKRDPEKLEEYKPYLHILERTRELQATVEKRRLVSATPYTEKYEATNAALKKLQRADSRLPEDAMTPRSNDLYMDIGECLFMLVDLSRNLDISPSIALTMYVSQYLQSHTKTTKSTE